MDFWDILLQFGPTPGSLVIISYIGYRIFKKLNAVFGKVDELSKAYTILNHNSSVVVRALLVKGILKTEDIADVELK